MARMVTDGIVSSFVDLSGKFPRRASSLATSRDQSYSFDLRNASSGAPQFGGTWDAFSASQKSWNRVTNVSSSVQLATRISMNRQKKRKKKKKEKKRKGERSRITTGYRWSFRRCHVVYANYFSVTNHFLANCLSRDCYTSIRFGEASGPLESFDLLESTCAAIVRVTYWPIADNACTRARTHR